MAVTPTASEAPAARPDGSVRVAYPEQPGAWHPALTEEPAAVDLAALWGLPLYRVDEYGQLRPALARDAAIQPGDDGRWHVDIRLRRGSWSDGRPVVAADVVATLEAMRAAPGGGGLAPLVAVEPLAQREVRLTFAQPYGRWAYLLAGGLSVLPAHVIATEGLGAYDDAVPVSGGWFRLASHEPGLRAVFEANPDGPLGAPRLARVEVYFTPAYDTALGLLRDHRVDVVAGHIAVNPVDRALRVDGVTAAAPLGGTWGVVRWREDGDAGGSTARRAAIRAAVDLSELVEGLLGDHGDDATSTLPGIAGPWAGSEQPVVDADLGDLSLVLARGPEVTTFAVRSLQTQLDAAGAELEIIRIDPQDVPRDREGDGVMLIRRDLPRPSMLARAPADAPPELLAAAVAADASARGDSQANDAAQRLSFDDAHELPLFRIGVAHAWRSELQGVRASSWPGLALWDVGAWRWRGGQPPEQVTTIDVDDIR